MKKTTKWPYTLYGGCYNKVLLIVSYSHRTVIFRGDLLNFYNVFFMGLADSQLILNLSTVFDSGGASDGVYRHGENVVKFCNFMDFPNKDLFSKFNFAHKVPPAGSRHLC